MWSSISIWHLPQLLSPSYFATKLFFMALNTYWVNPFDMGILLKSKLHFNQAPMVTFFLFLVCNTEPKFCTNSTVYKLPPFMAFIPLGIKTNNLEGLALGIFVFSIAAFSCSLKSLDGPLHSLFPLQIRFSISHSQCPILFSPHSSGIGRSLCYLINID